MGTLLSFVEVRVKFKFFPPVTLIAFEALWAARVIFENHLICLPARTLLSFILIDVRVPPEILPVVGVNTERFVVEQQVERAVDGLVFEEKKVDIEVVVVNKLDFDVFLVVRKGT